MKTILVLAEHPGTAQAAREALGAEEYRVIHRTSLQEAEPFLDRGLVDACVLDADVAAVQPLVLIDQLRGRLPGRPLVVYAAEPKPDWEEEAYLQGAWHVLPKPVRGRLLKGLLDRSLVAAARAVPAPLVSAPPPAPPPAGTDTALLRAAPFQALESLSALRDFSAILGDSLCAEALLRQFLLRLREVLGVNRSAVFLLQKPSAPARAAIGRRVLRLVCAVGVPAGLLEHVELGLDAGIGGYLHRQGRILRSEDPEARAEAVATREFELLGARYAVPIFDREALIGAAVLDGRVTGEALTSAELRLVFHLLEAMGLAVKNIWLHEQLAANHEMLSDVLCQFRSGCVVVGQDLSILHANKAARACFAASARPDRTLEFGDIPEALGSKIYQVLRTGTGVAPFRYEATEGARSVFQVSLVPVQEPNAVLPNSALLVIEDQTESEQLRRLEIEASNLRLVKQMADRLAHEVGNAMVPLSTHQQLFAKRYQDPEFRGSLDSALADGVRRVTRLVNQMRLLARDTVEARDVFPLAPLVEEAFQEAQRYQPAKAAQLKYQIGDEPLLLAGDRASLKHALAEILLNALQANPANPCIVVSLAPQSQGNGSGWAYIEFRDNGVGFTSEAAARAPEPFFTTRNVGLGLGLVVSRKVAEAHHGKLEIIPAQGGSGGVVRLSLPLAPAPAPAD